MTNMKYEFVEGDERVVAPGVVVKRIRAAAGEYERPSVLFRPRIYVDGDKWCALYGDDLQCGVAGFGDSPAEAMLDFDACWHTKLKAVGAK